MKHALLRLLYRLYRLQWLVTRPVVVGVRTMLVRDDQVLLVRHTYQDGWLIPGGKVERGETPEQAARRECMEEIGAQVGNLELRGIFTQFVEGKSDHIILFLCKDFRIVPKTNFEIEAVKFFKMTSLPDDLMPGNQRRIEEYLQGELAVKSGYW